MKPSRRKLNLFISLVCASSLAGKAFATDCNTVQLNQLFSLMAQRSSLMQGVAAYKFIKKQSVYDAQQEVKVLQTSLNLADTYQFNADKLMIFTQLQMDQAKFIQHYWISYWNANKAKQPDPAITPDISSLRTQIGSIDTKLYPSLASNLANLNKCPRETTLSQMNQAFATVKGIPQAPNYNLLLLAALKNIAK